MNLLQPARLTLDPGGLEGLENENVVERKMLPKYIMNRKEGQHAERFRPVALLFPGAGQLWMEQEGKTQSSSQRGCIHVQVQPGMFSSSSVTFAQPNTTSWTSCLEHTSQCSIRIETLGRCSHCQTSDLFLGLLHSMRFTNVSPCGSCSSSPT